MSIPYDLHGWGKGRLLDLLKQELQDLCEDRGVGKSGTKEDLVDRLLQWKERGETKSKSSCRKQKKKQEESEDSESEELEIPYALQGWGAAKLSGLRRSELQDLCAVRGIGKSGTTAELVDRLLQWKARGETKPPTKQKKKKEESEEEYSEPEDLCIPHNLSGWAETRLSNLSLADLRALCSQRGISSKSSSKDTLVGYLLDWKQELAAPHARSKGCDESDESTEDESPAARDSTESDFLRRKVTPSHREAVWVFRGGKDIYTGAARSKHNEYQVDHVIEIQVCKRAWEDLNYPHTRGREAVVDIVNNYVNNNVTTKEINNYKHYPFTNFLSDQRRPLSEHVEEAANGYWHSSRSNLSIWRNIERAVQGSYSGLKKLSNKHHEESTILLRFIGQVEVLMRKMKVLH